MTPKETAMSIIKDCEYIQELDYAVKNPSWRLDALEKVNFAINQFADSTFEKNTTLREFWKNVSIEILHYDLP